eukprot:4048080-Prymnesium_polylepis.1
MRRPAAPEAAAQPPAATALPATPPKTDVFCSRGRPCARQRPASHSSPLRVVRMAYSSPIAHHCRVLPCASFEAPDECALGGLPRAVSSA